jgi:Holliday junction resolvase RusA-like endonuclease
MLIELRITAPVVPKPRPRMGKNGCYLPNGYTLWESSAVLDLVTQTKGIQGLPIDYGIGLTIKFGGHCRGDLDNLIKSVCDALVKAQVLRDDSLSIVQSIYATWEKSRKPYCVIKITRVN